MNWVDNMLGICERVARHFAGVLLVIMLLMNLVNIFVRTFREEITFIVPWTMVLFVWMCFIGFFVISRRHRDVAVDFLIAAIGGLPFRVAKYVTALVIAAVAITVLLQAPKLVSLQTSTIQLVGIPRYYLSFPLFGAFLLILIDTLVTLYKVWGSKSSETGD